MIVPDVHDHVAELRYRYPGCVVWFGQHTRRWWALTRDLLGADRLVEALSLHALDWRLHDLTQDPRPVRWHAPPAATGPDGTWVDRLNQEGAR